MNKVYFGINGQFGDIVMQEPALRKFINDNPETKIVLGCHNKYFPALQLFNNYHDNIIEFKSWEGYNDWPTEADQKYIDEQGFDHMFETMPKHPTVDWAKDTHQTKEAGLMQGIEITDTQINLPRPEGIIQHEKTVAISLFPNWPHGGIKAFPYDWVCNIVKVINKMDFQVIHLNGPNEPDVPNAKKVNGTYLDSVRNLLGTDLLVTCDTGMSWVASAYQHPTVGFYAWGYNPIAGTSKNWQPTNPNANYIEAQTATMITRADIIKSIYNKVGGKK